MENRRILEHSAGWSLLGRLANLKLILLWCVTVAAFAGVGFYSPGAQIQGDSFSTRAAVQGAVLLGGLGVGIATCLTIALFILNRVQTNRLRKGWAVLWLAVSSIVSSIATVVVTEVVADSMPRDWNILRGENRMAIALTWAWTTGIAVLVFVLFTALVIFAGRALSSSAKMQRE